MLLVVVVVVALVSRYYVKKTICIYRQVTCHVSHDMAEVRDNETTNASQVVAQRLTAHTLTPQPPQ